MRTHQVQIKHFDEIWENTKKTFGDTLWREDSTTLCCINVPLHPSCYEHMRVVSDNLQAMVPASLANLWLSSEDMHITLMIPGRMGKQFQERDVDSIRSSVEKVVQNFPKFSVELGNINYFPGTIFREVYDRNGNIFVLHNQLADSIPFDLHPEYRYKNYNPHMSIGYLAGEHKGLIKHPKFNREIGVVEMKVEKIYFSAVTDAGHVYQQKILGEFSLEK